MNSVVAGRYYITEYLGSAAFSKVVQAHDLQMGMDICLKIIKNDKDFFDQSLDEIKLLKFVNKYDPADEHHILRLYDYFYYHVCILHSTGTGDNTNIAPESPYAWMAIVNCFLCGQSLYPASKNVLFVNFV